MVKSTNGYTFYFDDGNTLMTLPITPEDLTIKVGSKNEVVTLISEGDVNILKSPSLIEVSFDARFPMRKYPYSKTHKSFKSYYNFFSKLKTKKKSFQFVVTRTTPAGKRTWDTDLTMSLETFQLKESANEGDDVIVSFTLKQYKSYGVKKLPIPKNNKSGSGGNKKPSSTSTSNTSRDSSNKTSNDKKYTVKNGDCLWNIAKKFYGDGSKWTKIYKANKSAIEADAKKHGFSSSSNGHWIWAGLKLTIPAK